MKLKKKNLIITCLLICLSIIFTACSQQSSNAVNTSNKSNELKVHYIDVGQGDSILVQTKDKNILIDAGTRKSSDNLINYLKKQHIKKLDYVIATHPHEDHIGGMPKVIDEFEISNFYAPKKTANTKIFKDMILQLKKKNLKINIAKKGISLDLSNDSSLDFLAPVKDNYENTNDSSAVVKLTHGNTKFLFTGDAEKTSEKDILNSNEDLSSNVLKVGHHGSHSSSSKEFLDKINPKIAIISCGKNNDYGHPHKETMKELKKRNIEVYRTDIDGTILLTSDGENIKKN
ncbi:ComEC/Rec2 family competence protein [Clostridium botulinum]|uniref:MBL fold metallo-hydrolase n=2 Tax=Clostridium botulinum TaxID=1491 RepID=A0A846I8T1_CLOBO|nr:ComEC/Rec2 family competence protein [Clostridium botulinum]AJD27907.1 metallo-beta-lactamase superfamily protein [Clostridium botulinum CDC_297]ACQ54292.1 metallo-beta-lactamase family protein [Clostridium botulinum Ba4 str. 657]AJE12295.1 metallo-beta-lactamase superfamily protein [Clostridium botulinum CDC_1436]APR00810.1 beta-lactamase superfamily domain protein [Clostridium botulinum]APU59327.1 beta-lactamase superfamily domain protein [Clostridium botulinum]